MAEAGAAVLSPAPASGLGLLHGGGAGHGGSLVGAWGWRLGTRCPALAPRLGSVQGSAAREGADARGAGSVAGCSRAEAEGCGFCEGRQRGMCSAAGSQGRGFPPFFPICLPSSQTPVGLSSPWPAATTHHTKGELGPAAFSQIQRCRSSGASHGAGLMFPRLITAQDPFSFDCHGLDGQTPRRGYRGPIRPPLSLPMASNSSILGRRGKPGAPRGCNGQGPGTRPDGAVPPHRFQTPQEEAVVRRTWRGGAPDPRGREALDFPSRMTEEACGRYGWCSNALSRSQIKPAVPFVPSRCLLLA